MRRNKTERENWGGRDRLPRAIEKTSDQKLDEALALTFPDPPAQTQSIIHVGGHVGVKAPGR